MIFPLESFSIHPTSPLLSDLMLTISSIYIPERRCESVIQHANRSVSSSVKYFTYQLPSLVASVTCAAHNQASHNMSSCVCVQCAANVGHHRIIVVCSRECRHSRLRCIRFGCRSSALATRVISQFPARRIAQLPSRYVGVGF